MKFLYLSWKVGQPESHREDFSQEESKRESSWSQEQAQHPERDREIIPQLNPSTPLPHHAHSLPSASPPRALLQRPVAPSRLEDQVRVFLPVSTLYRQGSIAAVNVLSASHHLADASGSLQCRQNLRGTCRGSPTHFVAPDDRESLTLGKERAHQRDAGDTERSVGTLHPSRRGRCPPQHGRKEDGGRSGGGSGLLSQDEPCPCV